MTLELACLLFVALLMVLCPLVYGPGYIRALGVKRMAGNRENMPAIEGWFARGKRAHANLAENVLPFAIAVIVAHLAAVHTDLTRGAAVLFVVARLIHLVTYTAGFVPLRAPAYGTGVACTVAIAIAALLA